jgi:outer membrane protein assembly factor BamB
MEKLPPRTGDDMTTHGQSISALRTALFSATALLACAPAFGSDWPEWRNSTRDGTSAEQISTDWVARPPRNLWIKYVGPGSAGATCYSSVSIVGNRAYTMGWENGNDTVLCLDAATGANIWKFSYPSSSTYSGARATPNVTAGVVYTVSAGGNVFALNAASGSQVWNKDLAVSPGIVAHRWGLSGSPVISGTMVILNAGTEGIALDKTTGAIVWQTGNLAAGFSTPVPFTDNGTNGMMMFTATGVTAMSLAGAPMWRIAWPTNDNQNISDLIVSGDKFFICSGYWVGGGVYQLNGGTPARLWFNRNLSNYWITCVLKDGYLYGDQWNGSNDCLNCVEFATGALKWSKTWDRSFVQFVAGGKMLVISANGVMTMVELTPTAYTALASANVIGSTVNQDSFDAPPSFANGKLYIHSKQGAVNCVDISPPPSSIVYGDANGDGGFSLADINQMVDWLLVRSAPPASGSAKFTACDVNGDGTLSLADLNLFVDRLLGRINKFPVEP